MKILLRAGFLLLMLLAIEQRVHWFRLGQASPDRLTALAGDLTALGLRNNGPDRNGLIETANPGCPFAFPVGLFALDGGEDARIAALLPPDSQPLFIYLGDVERSRQRLHPVMAWLGANLAAMTGARPTQPPNKLVMVALPATCAQLAGLNWDSLSR